MKENIVRKSLFLCFVLSSVFQNSLAQFKNVILDSVKTSCTSAVAINPKNLKNVVVSSGANSIYFSFDEGTTWTKSLLQAQASKNKREAVLLADPKGNFYYFYLSDSSRQVPEGGAAPSSGRIAVQRSDDGGKTWEDSDGIDFVSGYDYNTIWPTLDSKGNIYLAWTQFDQNQNLSLNCKSNIWLSKSSNKGKKWSDPIQLSSIPGNCLDVDSMTTNAMTSIIADGRIFVGWTNHGKIFMDRSYDGGDMWLSNDIVLTTLQGTRHMNVNGIDTHIGGPVFQCDNSKSKYSGSLYLLKAEKRKADEGTDVFFMRSHNLGDNWTTPLRINDGEPGALHFKPVMTIDQANGNIYIVYYGQQHSTRTDLNIFLAYSTDGGTTFKNIKVSEKPFKPGAGFLKRK